MTGRIAALMMALTGAFLFGAFVLEDIAQRPDVPAGDLPWGLMLRYGVAMALGGALAGLLVIPTGLGLYPQAMNAVFVLGFTAAVVGGLDSAVGAVVGGLATGLILSFATGYLGSELTYVATLALLLVVLLLRPSGLFAGAHARRV